VHHRHRLAVVLETMLELDEELLCQVDQGIYARAELAIYIIQDTLFIVSE